MKIRLTHKLVHFLLVFFISSNVFSQVTIGSDTKPNQGALLDLKEYDSTTAGGITATRGGIKYPRVPLTDLKELFPFYELSHKGTPNYEDIQKPNHAGVVVYHTSDASVTGSEKNAEGLYMWNGKEWKKLEETLGKAELQFSCGDVKVRGSYVVNQSVDNSNYIEIPVTVVTAGSYNIRAISDNGYAFAASGSYMMPGDYIITAFAQGKPAATRTDQLELTNFGEKMECQIAVTVAADISDYVLRCGITTVRGVYFNGKELNSDPANKHYLTLTIDVAKTGSYNITSNTVDGISFKGAGEFTSTGIQTIDVYGEGIPSGVQTKTITLTTNSAGGTATECMVDIAMVIPKKRILSIGTGDNAMHNSTGKGTGMLFNNPLNFGLLEESTYRIEAPLIESMSHSDVTDTHLQPYLEPATGNPVDIVFFTFNSDLASIAAGRMLANYVKKGGVVIFNNEHMNTNSNAGNKFIEYVFEDVIEPGFVMTPVNDAVPGGKSYVYW